MRELRAAGGIRIVRLDSGDELLFAEARRDSLREAPRSFATTSAEFDEDAAARSERSLAGLNFALVALGEREEPVALAHVVRSSSARIAHAGTVVAVWTAERVRGRGVATALLDCLVEQAVAEGILVLSLAVVEGNAAAERLYRRAGFVPIGRDPLLLRIDGLFVPELILQLDLRTRAG